MINTDGYLHFQPNTKIANPLIYFNRLKQSILFLITY